MDDVLQRSVDRMLDDGAEFCDARFEDGSALTIKVVDKEVRALTDNRLSGVCLRARVRGSWGYSSSVDLDDKLIIEAAAKAVRAARSGTSLGGPIPPSKMIVKDSKPRVRLHPSKVSLEEKISMVIDIDSSEMISDKIVNSNSAYSEELKKNVLVNSFGSKIRWEEVRLRLMAMAVASDNGRTEMYYDFIDGSKGMELFDQKDLNEFGSSVAKEAVKTLSAVKPPSGLTTCVSDPAISGLLAHEVMGHASEADEVVKKRSFLTGAVGKQVANDQITMVDDGTLEGAYGSMVFDDEGTPSSRTTIIKNGIYTGYMHDLETAAEMGVKSTGNGRAQDFGRRMWVRMTNTFFEAGKWSLEEMLEEVKDGVMTDKMISGMEDPVGGGFEAKSLRGFLIEHGKVTKMVRQLTLTGNALEILRTTDAVGNKVVLDGGHCGKGTEDFVPVTSGGPYCRSKIIVGGD